MAFMKMNNIGVFSMLVPMAQVNVIFKNTILLKKKLIYFWFKFPFVISTFIGIKGMCNLPVESLMTSGMLWFPDLTAADPYFILPVLASGSILAIVAVSILALDAFINSAI